MNNLLRTVLSIAACAAFCAGALAVPAKPGLVAFRQADGTEIMVRIMGDERAHYYLSEDGYLLLNQADKMYYGHIGAAGRIESSGIQATAPALRPAAAVALLGTIDKDATLQQLRREHQAAASRRAPMRNVGLFDTGFPSKGKQKALVVLVEYTDVKFQTSYDPHSYFTRMLQEDGFSDYGGTGSCQQYFRENSMGQFLPEFDLYGPITLAHNQAYYGGNDWAGNDKHPEQMVIEACQQLDDSIDFSQYDRDNDGYIDNVYIFYAGRGEADGGSASTVWPHSWNITAATYTPYNFDGVRLDRYGCSNEWDGSRPDGIGTFVHEFSHVLGLPDLYATSYTSAFTPGAWSALDYGPYNNDGCTPPAYSVYERYSLDWIQPRQLRRAENIVLDTITNNDACMVATTDPNEFFLFENRQQAGWDKYIPGHGMLVWHIDYDQSVWENNTVNNTASHQYVDLEEADGTQTEGSRKGDAFPGTAGITSFTDDTRPSMKTWSGAKLNTPITDITESRGIIRFSVCGGIAAPDPVETLPATDIQPASFQANWKPSADSTLTGYQLTVCEMAESGSKTTLPAWNRRDVGTLTSVRIDSLRPATTYIYKVYAAGTAGVGDASDEQTVRTADPTFEYLAPTATAARDITARGFTATWAAMDQATSYRIEAYTKSIADVETAAEDFTGGIKGMGKGWTTSTTQSYANTAYSGQAVPALRLASDGLYVQSPLMDKDIYTLSFWHRGVKASADNRLLVMAADNTGHWQTVDSIEIVNAAGGATTEIATLPEGTRQVRIEYSLKGSGSVAIDDIQLTWGGIYRKDNLQAIDAGAMLSAEVHGLQPATQYYYTVEAASGAKLSRRSNEIAVATLAEEAMGIDALHNAAAESGTAYNLAGQRAGKGIVVRKGRKEIRK